MVEFGFETFEILQRARWPGGTAYGSRRNTTSWSAIGGAAQARAGEGATRYAARLRADGAPAAALEPAV